MLCVPVSAYPTRADFYFEGKFENGVAEGMVDPSLNPIAAFRLSVIQNSAVWAILNEVRQCVLSVTARMVRRFCFCFFTIF